MNGGPVGYTVAARLAGGVGRRDRVILRWMFTSFMTVQSEAARGRSQTGPPRGSRLRGNAERAGGGGGGGGPAGGAGGRGGAGASAARGAEQPLAVAPQYRGRENPKLPLKGYLGGRLVKGVSARASTRAAPAASRRTGGPCRRR